MTTWQVDLEVWLKPSVFDPQGHAVEQALQSLGHAGVSQVRIGKSMALELTGDTREGVEAEVREMCESVLCNAVMETYEVVRIEPSPEHSDSADTSIAAVGEGAAVLHAGLTADDPGAHGKRRGTRSNAPSGQTPGSGGSR